MSALTDRIAAVLKADFDDLPPSISDWLDADELAERIAAELQLTEEKHTFSHYEHRAVPGGQMSTYAGQRTQRRWVSAYEEVQP